MVRALARGQTDRQTNKQTDKQTNIPRTDQRLKTYEIVFQLLFLVLHWRSNCNNTKQAITIMSGKSPLTHKEIFYTYPEMC